MIMCIFNGMEYNSDTGRIIKKFDIYSCDLGEMEKISGGNIGKVRPCVIVSSNNINNPKSNQYLVAPIRTEHKYEITSENIQEFLNKKRSVGRLYVPIEFYCDDFRFIDIGQIRHVSSSKITKYITSIINPKIKSEINNALAFIHFTAEEFQDIDTSKFDFLNLQLSEDEEENDDFLQYYKKYKSKEMTVKQIATELRVSDTTVYKYIKQYRETEVQNGSTKMASGRSSTGRW